MEIRVEELRVALVLTEVAPGLPGRDDGGLTHRVEIRVEIRVEELRVALVLTEVAPGLLGGDDGGLGGLADRGAAEKTRALFLQSSQKVL